MYQCVHYIKYTSIYKVHVPMCPLYKVHLYYTKYMYQCVHYIKRSHCTVHINKLTAIDPALNSHNKLLHN